MTFEDKLQKYKNDARIPAREEAIKKTIELSKATVFASEQNQVMPYHEFLLAQFKIIQKRWWVLQLLLLILFWLSFSQVEKIGAIQRSMGVLASLFVILVIPELWKNINSKSMEIEAASYYSLHQVYAARMTLFGIVDVVFLSLFCGVSLGVFHLAFSDMLTQFLFPMTVTACICFGALCSKYCLNEMVAICMSLMWSILWWRFVLHENLYAQITMQVWIALFGIAVAFLFFAIHRTLHHCNQYWEVNRNGIED